MDKELVREIIEKGSNFLQKFAESAGSTASHLYGVLVRQQIAEGVGYLIGAFVFIGLEMFAYKFMKKQEIKYDEGFTIALVMILIVPIVSAGLSALLFASIGRLINPEFYAVKFIFDAVRPITK